MKSLNAILVVAMLVTSCSTLNEKKLPKFYLNNVAQNRLIVNRKAKYGLGKSDGCIIMSEINLSIISTDTSKITGEILDIESSKPIPFAQISFYANNTYKEFSADKNGRFSLFNLNKVQKLKISAVGYRNLIVDFNKKSF